MPAKQKTDLAVNLWDGGERCKQIKEVDSSRLGKNTSQSQRI